MHSPWCLGIGPRGPPHPSGSARWPGGEETRAAAAGEFSKVPPSVFFFLRKSPCSVLPLPPYKEGPVLSLSSPLQLYQGLSGSGSHMAQLSTLPSQCPRSPWVYHFILIPLPATSSSQVSLSVAQVLFGRGGSINSALSQESCSRPGRGGPGAAAALVPTLVPGTFLS